MISLSKKSIIILIFLPTLLFASQKIALFTPRKKTDAFWGMTVKFAQSVAQDLGMELKPYYAKGDHYLMLDQIKKTASQGKVDGMIVINLRHLGKKFIEICNKNEIPVIVINTDIKEIGIPGENYEHWIAEVLTDDRGGGKLLAETLIKLSEAEAPKIAGLGGPNSSMAAQKRNKGLRDAVSKKTTLYQIVPTDWGRNTAKRKFKILKGIRYPKINIAWTAADIISLGVYDGIKEMDQVSHREVITGGIDWSKNGIQAVREGKISATVGGHFMGGGWAMILFYDFFNNTSFEADTATFKSGMSVITKENIKTYSSLLSQKKWEQINFRALTKTHNKRLENYKFDFSAIKQQLIGK